MTAAIGLGTVIFLGAVLNLSHLAVAGMLDLLVFAGLALAAFGWFKEGRRRPRSRAAAGIALVLPLVCAVFLALSLTPLAGFNFHDDLERYFVYPVRMLAVGSLSPNPLGYLGADTLGAEAFLQGFFAAHLPVEYIGSVDLAGGIMLCLALAGFGFLPGRWAVSAAIAQLLVVAINPQLANISSVFLGAALIMAAVLLAGETVPEESSRSSPPLTGLLCAGIVALKPTFAVFVVVHLLATALVGISPLRRRLRTSLLAGAWTLVWLVPWLALHAPLYFAGLKSGTPLPPIEAVSEPLGLFSNAPLPYGSAQLHFTALATLGLLIAIAWGVAVRKKQTPFGAPAAAAIAAGLTAFASYLLLVAVLGPLMYGREAATRYAIPLLLGTLPAALRMVDAVELKPRWLSALTVGGGLAMTLFFAPSAVQRAKAMAAGHVPWAFYFSFSPGAQAEFLAYNREALGDPVRDRLARIQALVPPHETIAVWVMTPFRLDFRRNPIWHTDPYGLSMPWARWPADAGYFLIQHDGPAVRSGEAYEDMKRAPGASDRVVGFRAEAFLKELVGHANRSTVVYSDDTYALLKLPVP